MTVNVSLARNDGTTTAVRAKVQDKVFVDGKETDEWRTVKEIDLPVSREEAIKSEYLTKTRRIVLEEV